MAMDAQVVDTIMWQAAQLQLDEIKARLAALERKAGEGGGNPVVNQQTTRPAESCAVEVAPSPAPSASEIPAWVPSAEEIIRAARAVSETGRALDDPMSENLLAQAESTRRLIASRAPRPSTVSVEEMAERLYGVFHHAPLDLPWTDLGSYIKSYWLTLARSALSALPASEAPQPSRVKPSFHAGIGGLQINDVMSDATERPVGFIGWSIVDAMRKHVEEQPSRAAQPAPAATTDEGEDPGWLYDQLQEYAAAARSDHSAERTKRMVRVDSAIRRRLSSSRTPRVDVRRLLIDYWNESSGRSSEPSSFYIGTMTAALKAQGVQTKETK